MTFAIIVITVTLAAIFVAYYLDRVADFGRRDHEGELERRIEEQSAQIAQLVRALESRPERRPKVTRTRPEPPAAAPAPRLAPEKRGNGKRQIRITNKTRPELVEKAKTLRSHGMTYDEIANVLKVSSSTAANYVKGTYDKRGES